MGSVLLVAQETQIDDDVLAFGLSDGEYKVSLSQGVSEITGT